MNHEILLDPTVFCYFCEWFCKGYKIKEFVEKTYTRPFWTSI